MRPVGPTLDYIVFGPDGTESPFFLVHPVTGDPSCYRPLARHLAPARVVGLQAPGLCDDRMPLASVAELAAHHVETLRDLQPSGPYRLGGWAVGGAIAFEMSQALERAGETIALLALIDTRAPQPSMRGRPTDDRAVALEYVKYLLRRAGRAVPPALEQRFDADAKDVFDVVLDVLRALDLDEPDLDRLEIGRRVRVVQATIRAFFSYEPHPFTTPMTLFHAAEVLPDHPRPPTLGWEAFARTPIDDRTTPGTHFTAVLGDNAPVLAAALRGLLVPEAARS